MKHSKDHVRDGKGGRHGREGRVRATLGGCKGGARIRELWVKESVGLVLQMF